MASLTCDENTLILSYLLLVLVIGATLHFEVVEELCEEAEAATAHQHTDELDALLARVRVRFHYCSGEEGQPVAPLALHTDPGLFDKRSGGYTSADEVAAVLGAEEDKKDGAVVTCLSFEALARLQREIAAGHQEEEEGRSEHTSI